MICCFSFRLLLIYFVYQVNIYKLHMYLQLDLSYKNSIPSSLSSSSASTFAYCAIVKKLQENTQNGNKTSRNNTRLKT